MNDMSVNSLIEESRVSRKVLYAADLVLVIDATGSMRPVIDNVKNLAVGFHKRIIDDMRKKGKLVDQLRVRLIAFRDYYNKEEGAMVCTPFFKMPEEEDKFIKLVDSIRATDGGDLPENGLEALVLAIRSPWERRQDFHKFRHSIIVFTDASAHPLEHQDKPSFYPKDMPNDLNALTNIWYEEMEPQEAKRLTLLAPDVPPWNVLAGAWDWTKHRESQAGDGLSEQSLEDIIEAIVNSF